MADAGPGDVRPLDCLDLDHGLLGTDLRAGVVGVVDVEDGAGAQALRRCDVEEQRPLDLVDGDDLPVEAVDPVILRRRGKDHVLEALVGHAEVGQDLVLAGDHPLTLAEFVEELGHLTLRLGSLELRLLIDGDQRLPLGDLLDEELHPVGCLVRLFEIGLEPRGQFLVLLTPLVELRPFGLRVGFLLLEELLELVLPVSGIGEGLVLARLHRQLLSLERLERLVLALDGAEQPVGELEVGLLVVAEVAVLLLEGLVRLRLDVGDGLVFGEAEDAEELAAVLGHLLHLLLRLRRIGVGRRHRRIGVGRLFEEQVRRHREDEREHHEHDQRDRQALLGTGAVGGHLLASPGAQPTLMVDRWTRL